MASRLGRQTLEPLEEAMGRPASGEIRERRRKDGSIFYSARVRVDGRRHTVQFGTDQEGWTRPRVEAELEEIRIRIRLGLWQPPAARAESQAREQSFHQVASSWLEMREAEQLAPRTVEDYKWRLVRHLLPFFAAYRPSEIDLRLVERFKREKLREREEIRAARAAGVPLYDRHGQPRRPLSNKSINKLLELLAQILDDASESLFDERQRAGWSNPARGRRRRLKVSQRPRSFLEADELESLIQASGDIDRLRWKEGKEEVALEIRRLRDRKKLAWKKIAQRAGVAESTAIYLYQRLEQPPGQTTLVRRAIVATLGCAGLRNTELCALDWPDLVFAHRKIRVPDAKTPAGVREIAMTPRLLEELLAYRSSLDHVIPDAPAFPTGRRTRRNKDNLNARVLKPALRRADELRAGRGLPALPPAVSVHTLRRTYVSLMLAAGADLRWVQSQVGHEDAKMTLDVYAQVLQRKDRDLCTEAFDRLMADAIPSATAVKMTPNPSSEEITISSDHKRFAPDIAPETR
jgi:integrase